MTIRLVDMSWRALPYSTPAAGFCPPGTVHGTARLSEIARSHDLPDAILEPAVRSCVDAGYVAAQDGTLTVTAECTAEFDRVADAWAAWLHDELGDTTETPVIDEEFRAAMRLAADELITTDSQAERALSGTAAG